MSNTSPIQKTGFISETRKNYLDYAYFVIVSRALPDIRDGLKTVHRRCLYSFFAGNFNNLIKSSKIVGYVVGDFHPHGDDPVYQSIIRLGQDWIMRMPLVTIQGNKGSQDGDNPAHMRYTEVKPSHAMREFFVDWCEDVVQMRDNYDNRLQEPVVLPTRLPNLLINGSQGIAVGISTSIPPHNPGEIITALIYMLNNPNSTIPELLNYIKGPDFPTGGTIYNAKKLLEIYSFGEGTIPLLANYKLEDDYIVFYEIPYLVSKSDVVADIIENINNGKIPGASWCRDESNRNGIRIVVKVKNNANINVVLNQLLNYTALKSTFRICLFALTPDGYPKLYNLREMLDTFLQFRENIIIKKTRFKLSSYQHEIHILIGLRIALEYIDDIIKIIKESDSTSNAKEKIKLLGWNSDKVRESIESIGLNTDEDYIFSDEQLDYIVKLPLGKLAGLEKEKTINQLSELITKISVCNEILTSPLKRKEIILNDLNELKEKYDIKRQTLLIDDELNKDIKNLIPQANCIIMINNENWIKRLDIELYKQQTRGGKGRSSFDTVKVATIGNTHSKLLLFTNLGLVYSIYGYEIPEGDHTSRGRSIANIFDMKPNEEIIKILTLDINNYEDKSILFISSTGDVRRNELKDFINIRSNGKIYMADATLVTDILIANNNQYLVLLTSLGMASSTQISDYRIKKTRRSTGVKGCKLNKKDKVAAALILNGNDEDNILSVMSGGVGKMCQFKNYRVAKRNSKGVINVPARGIKNYGYVVSAVNPKHGEDIFLLTIHGNSIRFAADDLKIYSRYASGVKFCDLDNTSVAWIGSI